MSKNNNSNQSTLIIVSVVIFTIISAASLGFVPEQNRPTFVAIGVFIGVVAALATTCVGLFIGCKTAIKNNATGDFIDNVIRNIWGNLLITIALLPVVLLFYFLISIIVSTRLLCCNTGRITARNIHGAVIGISIGASVPVILLVLCVGFPSVISVWWLIGLLASIACCGCAGLSYPCHNPENA